jgi:hypothetical protein
MPITETDRSQLEAMHSIMRTIADGANVGQVLASFSRYLREHIERAGDMDLLNACCDVCGPERVREFEHIMREYQNIRDIHEPVFNHIFSQAEFEYNPYQNTYLCTNQSDILSELQTHTFTTRQGLIDGCLPGYYFDRMRYIFSDTPMHVRQGRNQCVFTGREIENLRDSYYEAQNSAERYTPTHLVNLVLDNSAGQYVVLGAYGQEVERFTSLEEASAFMNRGANTTNENRERITETRPRAALRRLSNAVTNALSPGQVSNLRPTPPSHVNARNARQEVARENLSRARDVLSTQMSNQYYEQFHRDLRELLDRYSLEQVNRVTLRSGEMPYREHHFEMRGRITPSEPEPDLGLFAWQRRLNKIVLCRVQEDPTLSEHEKTMQPVEGQEMLFRVVSRDHGRNRREIVLMPVFRDHESTGLLIKYLEVNDVVFIREVEQEEYEGILEERRKTANRTKRRIDFDD